MACVIYESFLQKTPPLDKLIVTWKKRWFVLTQKDPFNPRSVELNYYTDSSMSERRGTIDMTSITRIHPSPSKAKGHIFSIEVKDRKIMLKAEDPKTKSIWIAKLYEFAGQGHNYHVTVPHQPMAAYNEGLLQLSRAESQISIMPPTSDTPILDIPYSQIRRFGYQVVLENYDVIWCEICRCPGNEHDFCFFVVASGMDRAMLIAGDLKTKIEKDTGRFLIMEEENHHECTYISRNHYGCAPYPKLGRDRILHAGLVNLEATKIVSGSKKRRPTEPALSTVSVNAPNERRSTVHSLLGTHKTSTHSPSPIPSSPSPSRSRSPSPARSPSPNPVGVPLQDIIRRKVKAGSLPGSTSDPSADYTGKTLTAFDQGRRSDSAYLAMSDGAKNLSNWSKSKRPSEPALSTQDKKKNPQMGNKTSLAELHVERVAIGASQPHEKFFPSKDSGIGTSADLVLDQNGQVSSPFHSVSPNHSPSTLSKAQKGSQSAVRSYDHLKPRKLSSSQMCYDHLDTADNSAALNCPPVPPRSGISLGDPYVDA